MRENDFGVVDATGTALNIEVGYVPSFVEVVNQTDSSPLDVWRFGDADGTSVTTSAAGARTKRATNGISRFQGSAAGSGKGFTIGSGIATAGKKLAWRCQRGAD